MKVVAISGWKRSGKDTAAAHLIERYNFYRVAFADPLKDMTHEEYGVPRAHCDDPEFKEKPIMDLPVIPKDTFSLGIAKLMYTEFRDKDGNPPMEYHIDPSGAFLGVTGYQGRAGGKFVAQLYWTPRALCILKGSVNRSVRSDFWVHTAISHIDAHNEIKKVENFVISDLRYKSEMAQLREAFGKDLITVRVNRFDQCQSTDASERDLDNAEFDVVLENRGTLEEFIVNLDEALNERN